MKVIKYIPNALTFLRLILTCIFVKLSFTLYSNVHNNLCFIITASTFVLICATDFFDGRLARRFEVQSRLGSILDVTFDFIFITSSSIVLVIHNILPVWLIIMVIAKFFEFIMTSYIIKTYESSYSSILVFDYFGRAAAVNFFIIPGLALFTYIGLRISYINMFSYITLFLVLISALYRCIRCYKAVLIKNLNP